MDNRHKVSHFSSFSFYFINLMKIYDVYSQKSILLFYYSDRKDQNIPGYLMRIVQVLSSARRISSGWRIKVPYQSSCQANYWLGFLFFILWIKIRTNQMEKLTNITYKKKVAFIPNVHCVQKTFISTAYYVQPIIFTPTI